MQSLMLPVNLSGTGAAALVLPSALAAKSWLHNLTRHPRFSISTNYTANIRSPLFAFPISSSRRASQSQSFPSTFPSPNAAPSLKRRTQIASAPDSTIKTPPNDESHMARVAQVTKRLESTSKYFKRLGSFGFWGQLVCTLVAATILSFSVVSTGKITSPVTFYATSGGVVAAFVSVFRSFSYIRLSVQLKRTATDPSKAPPRADVIKGLKNGVLLNLVGMGAAVFGMQATIGLLVAKALTSSANPYYQGISPGYSPVLALDVFLVQASANTILSHFLGLVSSLELLRSVTLPSESFPPLWSNLRLLHSKIMNSTCSL